MVYTRLREMVYPSIYTQMLCFCQGTLLWEVRFHRFTLHAFFPHAHAIAYRTCAQSMYDKRAAPPLSCNRTARVSVLCNVVKERGSMAWFELLFSYLCRGVGMGEG
jgi:hypothetical protein